MHLVRAAELDRQPRTLVEGTGRPVLFVPKVAVLGEGPQLLVGVEFPAAPGARGDDVVVVAAEPKDVRLVANGGESAEELQVCAADHRAAAAIEFKRVDD